jgi:hypothetical protein
MLPSQTAIDIISKARQANVAQPYRDETDFINIFADFFKRKHFAGKRVLELGPGQYDFARRARRLGAEVDVIDSDPAVLELGRYLKFTTVEGDLAHWRPCDYAGQYDAIFCKFSISALWHKSPNSVMTFVRDLDNIRRPGGWGWIAPWNGTSPDDDPEIVVSILEAEKNAFSSLGWIVLNPSDEVCSRYGMVGSVANAPLFLKNLVVPKSASDWSGRAKRGLRRWIA